MDNGAGMCVVKIKPVYQQSVQQGRITRRQIQFCADDRVAASSGKIAYGIHTFLGEVVVVGGESNAD